MIKYISTYYLLGDIMLRRILKMLFSNFSILTASYSNNVFPEPLTKEEEDKYIEEHLKGNKEARDKLVEHNLRLVAHIVKKYDSKIEDTDDLISIGTIGLIKGVDSFSNKHGTKITTYCASCIENATITCWKIKWRLVSYLKN